MKAIDITGQRFGRLAAVKRVERPAYMADTCAWWLCRCDCGTEFLVRSRDLRHGGTKSCGCHRSDRIIALNKQRAKKK